MQLDVKHVPKHCSITFKDDNQSIDEFTRERFLYAYDECSYFTTVDFLKRPIIYFGYIPLTIQTDNGFEFTHNKNTNTVTPFDRLCNYLGINHQLICLYTPRHNGKVERSYRNDNSRFYNSLSFYSLDDLNSQMKSYLKHSNIIPNTSLNCLSPIQFRLTLSS